MSDPVTEQADAVLDRVRARVVRGEWLKGLWACGPGACLHTMLQQEVRAETRSGMPTPLDGRVFYTVWGVLPGWAESSIPRFNDADVTDKDDVLAVIASARLRLRTTSTTASARNPNE